MMSTAGLAGLKHPTMANAANLIYPRSIITDTEILNPKTSSGDDVFLLHHVKKEYGSKEIHFLNSKEATVRTYAELKLSNIFRQRIRWASKSRYYKDLDTILIGLVIAVLNFALLILLIGSFFSTEIKNIFIVLFVAKMIPDYLILRPILSLYKRRNLLIYFPILSFVYPFYISFVGIISQFVSFEWKGRKYK